MIALCQSVSLVIVVGGKHSNNTRQLAQRCSELGCKAIQVESADELNPDWLIGHEVVGLTAGTSTPDNTIDAVAQRLAGISTQEKINVACDDHFSQRWFDYFQTNQSLEPSIPWSDIPSLNEREHRSVVRSIQIFQLGETGSGRHFLTRARQWGTANNDLMYHRAAEQFIEEEHRHARWLGRFLDQEHAPRLQKQWSDSIFRRLRRLAGLRTSIAVLVSAEIMAQVYYRALKLATTSGTLQELCHQILREEAHHVRFQVQQLARIDRGRHRWTRRCARGVDRFLFCIASWIVYHDHRSVFNDAGLTRSLFNQWCKRRWQATELIYQQTK